MLKVRVIPCLDVKDGRVVKGINFVNLRDAGDPVEAASACDEAGADKVSLNPAAVKERDFVRAAAEKFGVQCIVVAIDAKRVAAGKQHGQRFEIFTHGGREPTGIEAVSYASEVVALGAGEILLTSMDRDGTKSGFDLDLTRAVSDAVSVPVIASGGVGNLDHLADGIQKGGADAVLSASMCHDGEYTVGEAKELMAQRGSPVRMEDSTMGWLDDVR